MRRSKRCGSRACRQSGESIDKYSESRFFESRALRDIEPIHGKALAGVDFPLLADLKSPQAIRGFKPSAGRGIKQTFILSLAWDLIFSAKLIFFDDFCENSISKPDK